jgi:hypothetical protein
MRMNIKKPAIMAGFAISSPKIPLCSLNSAIKVSDPIRFLVHRFHVIKPLIGFGLSLSILIIPPTQSTALFLLLSRFNTESSCKRNKNHKRPCWPIINKICGLFTVTGSLIIARSGNHHFTNLNFKPLQTVFRNL